ncbi:hypothetical protein [Dactylosporangium cerinum]|uniref:hypothetical protein n=1 Tax=Dactylosporangium cerinum TaxID=1434730 RepID=UPI0036D3DFBA
MLRAVVQVPFDLAARFVGSGDQAGSGRDELLPTVGVGDRRADKFGEVVQARLRIHR